MMNANAKVTPFPGIVGLFEEGAAPSNGANLIRTEAPGHHQTVDASADGPGASPQVTTQKRKKKDKVRSAWISFAGRIVAQIVGAAATIGLGVIVVNKYASPLRSTDAVSPVTHVRVAPLQRAAGEVAIAVLPLENFSGDARHEYVADGMTDTLVTELAQVRGLHVISRTSAMHYRGQRKPLPQIAQELGADVVVEGSIAVEGERVRIHAQLIDGKTDQHMWARTYDRRTRDILSLQADVASRIAQEVCTIVLTAQALQPRTAVEPTS